MKKIIKITNTLLLAFVFSFLLYLYIKQGPQAVVNISMPSIFVSLVLFVFSFAEIRFSPRRTYQVENAPGAMFMKLVRHVYSAKTIEEVFEPTQRDFLDEYADAISDYLLAEDMSAQSSAGWWVFKVRCKYYFAFLRAVAKQNVLTLVMRRMYELMVSK